MRASQCGMAADHPDLRAGRATPPELGGQLSPHLNPLPEGEEGLLQTSGQVGATCAAEQILSKAIKPKDTSET